MDVGDGNNSNGDGGSFRLGPDLLVKLKKGNEINIFAPCSNVCTVGISNKKHTHNFEFYDSYHD